MWVVNMFVEIRDKIIDIICKLCKDNKVYVK